MAIKWGSIVDDYVRLGYEFNPTSVTVSNSTSSVSVGIDIYIWTKYGLTDTSNTFGVSGDWSVSNTSKSISTSVNSGTGWSTSNQKLLHTVSKKSFSTTYGSSSKKDFKATLSGIEKVGTSSTITVSGEFTIPRRPYGVPDAPTTVAVSSVSQTSCTVSWTNNSKTSAPYASLELQQLINGTWTSVSSSLGATTTSRSVTGLSANTSYKFRVRAKNTDETSVWGYSPEFRTLPNTPSAPSGISTSSVSQTSCTVSWTNNSTTSAPYASLELERGNSNGTWTVISSSLGATTTSRSVTGLSANTQYRFRVRAKNAGGTSGWNTSSYFTTLPGTPSAPSSVQVTRVSDTSHTVSWTNNSTTSAPYASLELERELNGAWTSLASSLSSSTTSRSDTGTLANRKYRYRIRAKNAGGSSSWAYSPYFYTTPYSLTSVSAARSGGGLTVTVVDGNRTYSERKYVAQYSSNGGTTWTSVSATASTTISIASVPSGALKVRAHIVSDVGSLQSSSVNAADVPALISPPLKPTSVAASITNTSGNVSLTWAHTSDSVNITNSFTVQKSVNSGAWVGVVSGLSSSLRSHSLPSAVAAGESVRFRVVAVGPSSSTNSDATAAVVLRPLPPAVTCTPVVVGGVPKLRVSAASGGTTYRYDTGGAQANLTVPSDLALTTATTFRFYAVNPSAYTQQSAALTVAATSLPPTAPSITVSQPDIASNTISIAVSPPVFMPNPIASYRVSTSVGVLRRVSNGNEAATHTTASSPPLTDFAYDGTRQTTISVAAIDGSGRQSPFATRTYRRTAPPLSLDPTKPLTIVKNPDGGRNDALVSFGVLNGLVGADGPYQYTLYRDSSIVWHHTSVEPSVSGVQVTEPSPLYKDYRMVVRDAAGAQVSASVAYRSEVPRSGIVVAGKNADIQNTSISMTPSTVFEEGFDYPDMVGSVGDKLTAYPSVDATFGVRNGVAYVGPTGGLWVESDFGGTPCLFGGVSMSMADVPQYSEIYITIAEPHSVDDIVLTVEKADEYSRVWVGIFPRDGTPSAQVSIPRQHSTGDTFSLMVGESGGLDVLVNGHVLHSFDGVDLSGAVASELGLWLQDRTGVGGDNGGISSITVHGAQQGDKRGVFVLPEAGVTQVDNCVFTGFGDGIRLDATTGSRKRKLRTVSNSTFAEATPILSSAEHLERYGNNIDSPLTTQNDLAAITPHLVPTGSVMDYAGGLAPDGWLFCRGQAVSRQTYAALFAVIGTTYGAGDGSTTFNLPDYRGRVGAGWNTNDSDFNVMGKKNGAKTHTLSIAEMPSHRHTPASGSNFIAYGASGKNQQHTSGADQGGAPMSYEGGGQAHNNLQPYIVVNKIIKT